MTKIQTVAKTHVGQVRDHNEDTFIVGLDPVSDAWVLSFDEHEIGDKGAVFVVADGMGGENAGEIAAEIAVQSIRAFIQAELKKEEVLPVNKILESALIYAHNCIKDACRDNADYIGMGTTATVCMLKDNKVYVSWIGDTRVYRYSKHGRVHALPYHFKNLDILSEDHSKVWQMMQQGQITLEGARTHEQSNIITQSLGDLFRTPQPESREYPLFKDDHILICSDGLNGMLSDDALERIFSSEIESLDKIAEQMITEANLAGGHDNITLILTKVTEGVPYSDDIVKKGTGEKTIMTEALPKKKNKLVFYVLSSLILAAIVFASYHFRNRWIPWFNKQNPVVQQDSTSISIDTSAVSSQPVPTIEHPTPAKEDSVSSDQKTPTNSQKKPASKPGKPKQESVEKPKLINPNILENESIDTSGQNKK